VARVITATSRYPRTSNQKTRFIVSRRRPRPSVRQSNWAILAAVAAFPDLLRKDRERRGFTVCQVAWRLGVKPQEYRELEVGTRWPDYETWDRICKLYAWPQRFVGQVRNG
jgi:ribosome-binding protein aMBF1 (putative translation factor)